MQYTTISDVQDLPASAVVDIYGAGGSGAVLLEAVQSQRPDCRIERFIDGMKGPGEFNGLPVVRADAVSPEEYGQKCLVVASVYFQEILQRLGQAGFSRAFVYRPEEAPIKRGYLALPVLASVSVENGSLRVVHNGSELPKGVSLAGVVLGPEQGTEEHRLLEQELVGICERAGAMCEFVADAPAISASEFIFPTPQDCTLVYDCRAETALVYFTIQALLAANPGKPVLYMKRNKPFVAEALEVP